MGTGGTYSTLKAAQNCIEHYLLNSGDERACPEIVEFALTEIAAKECMYPSFTPLRDFISTYRYNKGSHCSPLWYHINVRSICGVFKKWYMAGSTPAYVVIINNRAADAIKTLGLKCSRGEPHYNRQRYTWTGDTVNVVCMNDADLVAIKLVIDHSYIFEIRDHTGLSIPV